MGQLRELPIGHVVRCPSESNAASVQVAYITANRFVWHGQLGTQDPVIGYTLGAKPLFTFMRNELGAIIVSRWRSPVERRSKRASWRWGISASHGVRPVRRVIKKPRPCVGRVLHVADSRRRGERLWAPWAKVATVVCGGFSDGVSIGMLVRVRTELLWYGSIVGIGPHRIVAKQLLRSGLMRAGVFIACVLDALPGRIFRRQEIVPLSGARWRFTRPGTGPPRRVWKSGVLPTAAVGARPVLRIGRKLAPSLAQLPQPRLWDLNLKSDFASRWDSKAISLTTRVPCPLCFLSYKLRARCVRRWKAGALVASYAPRLSVRRRLVDKGPPVPALRRESEQPRGFCRLCAIGRS